MVATADKILELVGSFEMDGFFAYGDAVGVIELLKWFWHLADVAHDSIWDGKNC